MISARLLHQFIAVAEELHFGRAAVRLHMAQPPLSQAIKNLEDLVGVPLLARNRHSVQLLPAGKAFLAEARELLDRGKKAIDAAVRASEGMDGRLTIGFVGSVSYELLPRLLARIRENFPRVHIDLRELTSAEQAEQLLARKIDLGIVRLPVANLGEIETQVIETERLVAVLPITHPLAGKQTLWLKDLEREPFMAFPSDKIPSLHGKFLLACEASGFNPRIALEAWQMSSMVSLVAANFGVALLPRQVVVSPHHGVIYKELADEYEHLSLNIAIAWQTKHMSPTLSSVLSLLQADLKS
ncbi:LysR family transcriptional regulator [Pseudomonas fluorescens]|nr:LysR family transcriptional regulator [Pseudomonas fluorescens]